MGASAACVVSISQLSGPLSAPSGNVLAMSAVLAALTAALGDLYLQDPSNLQVPGKGQEGTYLTCWKKGKVHLVLSTIVH